MNTAKRSAETHVPQWHFHVTASHGGLHASSRKTRQVLSNKRVTVKQDTSVEGASTSPPLLNPNWITVISLFFSCESLSKRKSGGGGGVEEEGGGDRLRQRDGQVDIDYHRYISVSNLSTSSGFHCASPGISVLHFHFSRTSSSSDDPVRLTGRQNPDAPFSVSELLGGSRDRESVRPEYSFRISLCIFISILFPLFLRTSSAPRWPDAFVRIPKSNY